MLGSIGPHFLGEAVVCCEPGLDEALHVVAVDPLLVIDVAHLTDIEDPQIDGLAAPPALVQLPDRRLGFAYRDLGSVCLADLLQGRAPPVPWALSVMRQVFAIIGRLHLSGHTHGALNLRSVMLTVGDARVDTVSVADYGLRGLVPRQDTVAPNARLTGVSFSPERGLGLECGPEEDVYALGCIAFALFTGELPFKSSTLGESIRMHVLEDAPEMRPSHDSIEAQAMAPAIERALSKDARDRQADASVLYRELTDALEAVRIPSISAARALELTSKPVDRGEEGSEARSTWDDFEMPAQRRAETGWGVSSERLTWEDLDAPGTSARDSESGPARDAERFESRWTPPRHIKPRASARAAIRTVEPTRCEPAVANARGTESDPYFLTNLVYPVVLRPTGDESDSERCTPKAKSPKQRGPTTAYFSEDSLARALAELKAQSPVPALNRWPASNPTGTSANGGEAELPIHEGELPSDEPSPAAATSSPLPLGAQPVTPVRAPAALSLWWLVAVFALGLGLGVIVLSR